MNKVLLENTLLSLLKFTPGLGRVQVYKGLIFIDAIHFAYYGKSLTGITYVKDWYGPVPSYQAANAIKEFNSINITWEAYDAFAQCCHYAKKDPDYSVFAEKSTLDIIRDVAQFIIKMKAKELSQLTHDSLYENTDFGEEIPLNLVAKLEVGTSPWTDTERTDAKNILEEISASGEIDLSQFCT